MSAPGSAAAGLVRRPTRECREGRRDWLREAASWNPLTYQVDALRHLMIQGAPSAFGMAQDFAVQALALLLMAAAATALYPRIVD